MPIVRAFAVCLSFGLFSLVAQPLTTAGPTFHAVITLDDGSEITVLTADELKFSASQITGDRATGRTELWGDVKFAIKRNGVDLATVRTPHAVVTRKTAK